MTIADSSPVAKKWVVTTLLEELDQVHLNQIVPCIGYHQSRAEFRTAL